MCFVSIFPPLQKQMKTLCREEDHHSRPQIIAIIIKFVILIFDYVNLKKNYLTYREALKNDKSLKLPETSKFLLYKARTDRIMKREIQWAKGV